MGGEIYDDLKDWNFPPIQIIVFIQITIDVI